MDVFRSEATVELDFPSSSQRDFLLALTAVFDDVDVVLGQSFQESVVHVVLRYAVSCQWGWH